MQTSKRTTPRYYFWKPGRLGFDILLVLVVGGIVAAISLAAR